MNNLYLLFERAANMYPDEICVLCKENKITYEQLKEQISRLCHVILQQAPNDKFIGLPTTRNVEQIAMLLAILKAGKAYLPLDLAYPKNRLKKIIKNSNLTFSLSTKVDIKALEELDLRIIQNEDFVGTTEFKNQNIKTESPSYILYTSGSTGEPKGVSMGHEALTNLINWQNQNSKAGKGTRTLQFAPLSFDVSFQEIISTLSTGGTLILIDNELRLDMVELLKSIEAQAVNRLFLPFVALQALAETAISIECFPNSLNEIMTAGEQLKITPQLIDFFSKLNNCTLYNQYGPTECHVVSEFKLEGSPKNWPVLPSIGKPIDNTFIVILDEKQNILPNGDTGELCIGGICLADGYLGNKKLTEEKFISVEYKKSEVTRMYRTGDLARYLPDGNIEFLGRKDDQVKISGHRIELAEVELAINNLHGVQQAVVIASNHLAGQMQLVAYIQSNRQSQDKIDFRKEISSVLPDYMIPSIYMWVNEFPLTSSGKIDKKALPLPEYSRPSSAPPYKKPISAIQKNLAKEWIELLKIPKIGIDDNFFELGGTSLLAQKLIAMFKQNHGYHIPITKLYQFPSIDGLSNYLNSNKDKRILKSIINEESDNSSKDIAIIGMAGRFPGAKTIEELWDVLKEGKETISFFSEEQLDASISESLRLDPLYVKARGIVPTVKEFDASFFGLNPKVAEAMDPQQRLFLEIAWEVLERSGYLPNHYDGSVGVYAGTGTNTYYINNVLPNHELLDQVGYFQASTLNEKDYISSRTAYHLNLKGPAVSVHSACSTSLLAIAEAVQAIRSNQCDVAIAGGSSITAPIYSGHLYQEGSMLSPDGHCRSFDASGKGTVFSDGAGVVLLKSLNTAQKDGDIIYGIIKGVGINNDGGNKGSFTAPSAEGQADAINKAMHDAQISPSTISYIEAHGTATPIGDPIEIEGLQIAFGEQALNNYCAIGSIKSNMGHLTAAAGVAGLIKTILALNHKKIPPSLGYSIPNPVIDFDNSPFFVNNKLTDWDTHENEPRRAGISSFGVGGTNVHVVVEEYTKNEKKSSKARPLQIVAWSAKTETSLENYKTALTNHLLENPNLLLADMAYSLSTTRGNFSHRNFLLANENDIENLLRSTNVKTSVLKNLPNEVVFLFPGQGAQYTQMGRDLYDNEKIFREAVDTCANILLKNFEFDLRKIIFPDNNQTDAEVQLKNTRFTQPALFVIEYALSQLWMSWGIKPTVFCGHSIGEFVAAHLADVITLEDALHLIAIRGRLVSELPEGGMLSVRLNINILKETLPDSLSIAAVNSDHLCVVSGPNKEIENFANILRDKNILHKPLSTSHAFHSSMMDSIIDAFGKEVEKITLRTPNMPIISTVTGTWLSNEEATNPKYWANHLRATVQFTDAMDTILALEDPILLEVGPGNTLTTLARQKNAGRQVTALTSLPIAKNIEGDYSSILNTLGQLWLAGIEPDWVIFYSEQGREKVTLPPYQFDRKPCWTNPPNTNINTKIALPIMQTDNLNPKENNTKQMRKPIILEKISEIITNASGIEIDSKTYNMSFLELGLDSLILTQIAITCKREFNIPITFRQLNEELSTPENLANHLDLNLPNDKYASKSQNQDSQSLLINNVSLHSISNHTSVNGQNASLEQITQQFQLLSKQLDLLKNNKSISTTDAKEISLFNNINSIPALEQNVLTDEEKLEHKKPFGASAKIERHSTDMGVKQKAFLEELIDKYNKKTASSKAYAQKHRSHMADPRVVSGFKPTTKELVYPLVIEKSSGNRLWDIDGNEYMDALNGFGSSLFGHQPDFIKEILHQQIEDGYEVGPQHPLAGEVCELLCKFTGHDRAALCNTGSEAVLGAMRIARTVTGRSLIVAFSGSYHGINDEVIVRGSKKLMTFPAAPGILPKAVENMLILDYGTEDSLNIIRERANELAAVLVEPVQSRRPEFQPVDFLKKIREITTLAKIPLIFDEVITGFRVHPGGAQAMFNIKADLATYGKVIGGGLPIGAIMGNREYMDALDGGFWQYQDNSYPEIGVTYFAGTFVRHPLALAAAKASLNEMLAQGPKLQNGITTMAERLAAELNTEFIKLKLPMFIAQFGSLWRLKFNKEIPYSELLFVLLREKGIHIWDGFPCFITTAYTSEDIDRLIKKFIMSTHELIDCGIFDSESVNYPPISNKMSASSKLNSPPLPGARLGRDEAGNPAWFIPDVHHKGDYIKIDL
jgi:amino acid adenylation domain-containing protein